MLTKEEREAIAERVVSFNGDTLRYVDFYKCLLGEYPQDSSSSFEDDKAILDRILALCDTSNMVELPRDKDGEVIHIGDEVCDEFNSVGDVTRIEFVGNGNIFVHAYDSVANTTITHSPNRLTHKATTTITENVEAFNEAVKATAQYVEKSMNKCVEAMKKLAEVFNSLGDSDD